MYLRYLRGICILHVIPFYFIIEQVMMEKFKEMVMVIWDAVDKYYAESVRWPHYEGNPKDLLNVVKQVNFDISFYICCSARIFTALQNQN